MPRIRARNFKGTRDHLPEEMILRQELLQKIQESFEHYAFVPLQTPAIEYQETLYNKYGPDAEKLMYSLNYNTASIGMFCDKDSNKVFYQLAGYSINGQWKQSGKGEDLAALRYDLTVPLARVLSQHKQDIALPLRRYQIQPVWRADRAQIQQGRFREFLQCDIDIIGTDSPLADAEILTLTYETLQALKIGKFSIRLNHRKLLRGILELFGVSGDKEQTLCQALDKLHKAGENTVCQELTKKNLPAEKLMSYIKQNQSFPKESHSKHLRRLEESFHNSPTALAGVEELSAICKYTEAFQVPEEHLTIDMTLARGLDYYTGMIYEVQSLDHPHIGSLSGGGRYNNLLSNFQESSSPAVGGTLGLERILTVLAQSASSAPRASLTEILITQFEDRDPTANLQIAQRLRQAGFRVEIHYERTKITKQVKYAQKRTIPYVIFLGDTERTSNQISIKSLQQGTQETISQEHIEEYFTKKLR